ncbi:hypothetical protein J4Q44_G00302780 [Coregonus suidteri]|uniref:Ig-like domain-containing protein n=1 Tax=Coregonus suidteri TaxID=861788 RepID=A0AAN8KVP5_9TELE
MRVSCSSEGDAPQYRWTLDRQMLRDTEDCPCYKRSTITLRNGLPGDLTCTVRNYICSATTSKTISPCPGSLVAVVLVLAVVVGVYCIRKRRTPPQSPGMETHCDATLDGAQCYGALGGTVSLQLMTIDTPVSSPQLSSQCLTHGEMRVTCSSEGDGPQYSWTLDGHTQRDTEASPGDETNTITLKKGLSGDLTCTVKNKINSVTVSKIISPCEDIIGIVTGSLTGIVLVLVMVLAVYCVQKKNKPPKTPVNVNSQDVEYADVRTLKNQMRQQERKVEYGHLKVTGGPLQPMEVDYGQIEILEGLRKVDTPEEEDCVYARVRKGQ